MNKLEERVKELEEGIKELIAYGMPKHIEDGLIKLIQKGGGLEKAKRHRSSMHGES